MSPILGLENMHAVDCDMEESIVDKATTPSTITIDPMRASRLVFLTEPTGLAVEQYKLLRRRLRLAHPEGGLILVTSPGPGEGKTLTSMNLAWCLAQAGHNTCLVDLDFRAPGLAAALGITPEHGVESVLSGRSTLLKAGVKVLDLPLHIYPVKHRLESPEKYLAPSVLSPFTKSVRAAFEWVILDLVPAVPMSDVAEVLPYVDGALMVVRAGKTSAALLKPSLEIVGSKLRGAVLNDSTIKGSAYYGDYGKRGR
jgi:Mrp family chromosome partitioning ATPase